ncbi:hypothetical protein OC844_001266 [Tilletia horrida]|nr:hypothetical protein OC844_001266 [Tilletia horrida]
MTPPSRSRAAVVSRFVLLLLVAVATSVHAYPSLPRPVKRFSLIVSEQVIWPDGNPVSSVLLNGSFPGPEIRVHTGDRVLINVTNAMADQNTTLHVHGMSQRMTPSSDGTPLVSQWPIAPGNWFEYEFVTTDEDIGSYYYHSHVGMQALTANGPFIVEGRVPSIYQKARTERTLMLGDWYWQDTTQIVNGLLGNPFVWLGSSKAILLNGQAVNNCNATIAQMNANLTCADTPASPSVVSVPYSTDVRLRLIGALALSYTSFGILNHTLDVIAADGTYLEPVKNQSHVEIMAGQRYDLVLHSKSAEQVQADATNGCYWIRMESRWRNPTSGGWGLLAYPSCTNTTLAQTLSVGPPLPANTTTTNATLLPPAQFGWIASQFAPLRWSGSKLTQSAPKDEDVKRRIVIQAQNIGWFGTPENGTGARWAENGHVYNEGTTSPVPYLVKIFTKSVNEPSYERAMQGTPKGYDNVTDTYVAKSGEVFDMVIVNNASAKGHNVETHPWHGHTYKQWTIASGMGNFTEEALAAARADGFKRPIARDTHTVWPGPGATTTNQTLPANSSGGWTVIRYRVAPSGVDTGAWLLHCHLLPHQAMGMSLTLIFDAPNLAAATGYDE